MYHLFIATPESVLFDGQAKDLIAPGASGFFEVLTNHAPLISTLLTGTLTFQDSSDTKRSLTLTGGICEVDHNNVSILLDAATF